jgi:hypothetical protein
MLRVAKSADCMLLLLLHSLQCRISAVSRYAGAYEHVFETVTAGITLQSPQLDINTVR